MGGTDQVHLLATLVDIYAARLFPVWPILDPGDLKLALQAKPRHHGTWRLANAVGLATVAQLKLDTAWHPDLGRVSRDNSPAAEPADPLDDLRVSFFLHVHHENSTPGGRESLLYLREAITLAQILRLEHEGAYDSLPEAEQHMYRRVLWLLFVTER
ncbi:fungal specific transcription factor domain-containing protein [Candidatus Bathyarchaeota archaeon]|nr:fungal specific transcription factor domain-containing protein [Candidatus Bathyarchaeota archaeon]